MDKIFGVRSTYISHELLKSIIDCGVDFIYAINTTSVHVQGLGITMFGMAYMFVHDGLVHRRFPVGPVADVPYLQKVAAAHQVHYSPCFLNCSWVRDMCY
jgi:hypothetical protein